MFRKLGTTIGRIAKKINDFVTGFLYSNEKYAKKIGVNLGQEVSNRIAGRYVAGNLGEVVLRHSVGGDQRARMPAPHRVDCDAAWMFQKVGQRLPDVHVIGIGTAREQEQEKVFSDT